MNVEAGNIWQHDNKDIYVMTLDEDIAVWASLTYMFQKQWHVRLNTGELNWIL